jgi:hypothetical protein
MFKLNIGLIITYIVNFWGGGGRKVVRIIREKLWLLLGWSLGGGGMTKARDVRAC